MNVIAERILANWKTSVGGALAVALVVIGAVQQNNPNQHWTLTAGAIVAGLTGLIAKD